MPSKSKQQQKFFGVVKSMQKGDTPKKGAAGEVADDMDKKEIDKMASTKHTGLPNKIKEMIGEELQSLNEIDGMRVVMPKIRSDWVDEIIIVDGGSTDGTIDYAQENGYQIYVQKQEGFRHAYCEILERINTDYIIAFSPDVDQNQMAFTFLQMISFCVVGYLSKTNQ